MNQKGVHIEAPKLFAFDCDEVVFNIRDSMAEALSAATGREIHWSDWWTYDLCEVYKLPDLTVFKQILRDAKVLEKATLEPEILPKIKEVRLRGYAPVMVTSRGWHEQGQQITEAALMLHNLPFFGLTVLPIGECKAQAIKKVYGSVFCLYDDNPEIIELAAEHPDVVTNLMLRDRPWNKSIKVEHRVATLDEFVAALDRMEGW